MRRALQLFPVVVVTGARQTGKTTLVQSMPELQSRPYVTMDSLNARLAAETDPHRLVEEYSTVVIDEVQRVRSLLLAIKQAVDESPRREPGRFVLTGSANLLLMESIGESLAGRAAYVTLHPMTRRELRGLGSVAPFGQLLAAPADEWPNVLRAEASPPGDWRDAVRRGGLPVPAYELKSEADRRDWLAAYIQTYLERDVRTVRNVENLADFRRLLTAVSLRGGSIMNQAELGRDVGLSQPQVHRFLSVMEAGYMLYRLPAYAVNRTRRLIKAPRLFLNDPALAMALAGDTEPKGAHLENLVLSELLAWRDTQPMRPELLYWRTATGQEVDFVIETPARLLPIEVKATTRVSPADIRGLTAFLDEYPDRTTGGLLLYGGEETVFLTPRILAAPWWAVL
jgi:predicted AAA+ superfamily ATPase